MEYVVTFAGLGIDCEYESDLDGSPFALSMSVLRLLQDRLAGDSRFFNLDVEPLPDGSLSGGVYQPPDGKNPVATFTAKKPGGEG